MATQVPKLTRGARILAVEAEPVQLRDLEAGEAYLPDGAGLNPEYAALVLGGGWVARERLLCRPVAGLVGGAVWHADVEEQVRRCAVSLCLPPVGCTSREVAG